MIWFDQFRQRVLQERLVTVTAAMSGGKGTDGQPIEITDVDRELEEFDLRLSLPLNHERMRALILKEVSR